MRAAFSSALIHRLNLEFPIQSNPSPYTKRITHHNVRSKKRARKGGARGGKTGFATLSAFPLVPAHAKMVPLKGKVPASQASPGKGITCVSSILPERENILPEGDQASVSSWNCGIGVTGGQESTGGSSNSPEIFR